MMTAPKKTEFLLLLWQGASIFCGSPPGPPCFCAHLLRLLTSTYIFYDLRASTDRWLAPKIILVNAFGGKTDPKGRFYVKTCDSGASFLHHFAGFVSKSAKSVPSLQFTKNLDEKPQFSNPKTFPFLIKCCIFFGTALVILQIFRVLG